jgi:hypothetical protein
MKRREESFDDLVTRAETATFDELFGARRGAETFVDQVAKVVGMALVPVTIAGASWLAITQWESARWVVFAIVGIAILGAMTRARVIGSNLLLLASIAALIFGLVGAGVFVYERGF